MTLMQRRRALMGGDPTLVFSVENKTVNTGDRVTTDFIGLQTGQKYTVLLDFTNTVNPTSGTARLWRPIIIWNGPANLNGIVVGKNDATDTVQKAAFMGNLTTTIPNSNPSPGRHRYCLIRNSDNGYTLHYKKNSDTISTVNPTGTLIPANGKLFFGDTGNTSLPAGTLTARIYTRVISQSEINAFFA